MGSGVNICALLVGLAAFASWTVSRFTVPRRVGWVNFLGGVGILALFFSIVSPDDDGFQQELICPRILCGPGGIPATSTVLMIDLVNANHEVFPGQSKTVTFTIPAPAK